MSVDHDTNDFDLPEAKASERGREQAIFRALAAFEDRQQRQGKAAPARPQRFHFGALLMRPGFATALASGAALIVAVPIGIEMSRQRSQPVWRESMVVLDKGDSRLPPKAEAKPAKQVATGAGAPDALKKKEQVAAVPVAPPVPVAAIAPAQVEKPAVPEPAAKVAAAPTQSARSMTRAVEIGANDAPAPPPGPRARGDVAGDAKLAEGDETVRDLDQLQAANPEALPDAAGKPAAEVGRDKFANAPENGFKSVVQEPLSTFSIDVDTASYAYVRATLNRNLLPQPAAVRTEELINYFPYDYAQPKSAAEPFSTAVAVMPNPWAPQHKLMRIGIKGYALDAQERPPANLVFLIDTSGSMDEANKLPLLVQSLGMLVDGLRPQDKVAIVAYAGSAGVVLPSTPAAEKERIIGALENLHAGGSTAGGEGIRLAYRLAEANFDAKAVNRVMLATDGDFNVGITNQNELKGFVERERGKGIFLSVLGFGMGNYNDAMMQALAQNGNGVAAYIDTLGEARKVLVEEASSALFPIAKDVKIQVEFNPAQVSDYRLIGYETRLLNRDDFNNDKVDAGEVGSGASVTALYDIVPAGLQRPVDESRYQPAPAAAPATKADEYAFVKIRYKLPKSDSSTLITTPATREQEAAQLAQAPTDARFAVAVAGFGEYLRGGKHIGAFTLDDILALAIGAKGEDAFGYRAEFVNLVRAAKAAKGLPESAQ